MHVFLSADSFATLVAAVAEGFKNEVGGILFGDTFPSVDKMLIKQVIPLQTAKRGYSSVEFHPERTFRVLDMWDNLTIHWPLGWFHSHPAYGSISYVPEPSDDDIEFMDQSEVMLIVSIKEAKRRDKLGYAIDAKRITGAVGTYHIEIAGWNLDDDDEVEEADVWCPYIDLVNLGRKAGIVSRYGGLFDHDTLVGIRDMRKIRRLVLKYEDYVFRNLGDYGAAPMNK
jgi:proteasome lid subunit RPN8/RPN11